MATIRHQQSAAIPSTASPPTPLQTWEGVLRAIPQDHRSEFIQYIRTGEGTSTFLEKLEANPVWKEVVDAAMDLLVAQLVGAVHHPGPTAVVLPAPIDQSDWRNAFERAEQDIVPVVPDEATAGALDDCPPGPEPVPLLLAHAALGGEPEVIDAAILGVRVPAGQLARSSELNTWIKQAVPAATGSGVGSEARLTRGAKYGVVVVMGYRRLPKPIRVSTLKLSGGHLRSTVLLPPSFTDWYLESQRAWVEATKRLPGRLRAELAELR